MKWFLGSVGALIITFFAVESASAQGYICPHQSTQARVQNNVQTPWTQSITVGCDRTFNVGSFHNGIDRFAEDTWLNVVGPNNFGAYFKNGQTITVPNNGTYYLFVSTQGQFVQNCYDVATVNVVCNDTQQPPVCPHQSTQARVQKDDRDPWKQNMQIRCGEKFRVGSFHNGIDQFASDTQLRVTGPDIFPFGLLKLDHTFKNADALWAVFPGTYTLHVTTPGRNGTACEERATVQVSCPAEWWRI